jgi:virginiamycin B lyase
MSTALLRPGPKRFGKILLVVALLVPVGLFVRQEWRDARTCEQEFGSEAETDDYEICRMTDADPEATCGGLESNPFRCSEEFIAGHGDLLSARNTGIYQTRLECAIQNQVSMGTRCSQVQWDGWCAARHGAPRRRLPRCRTVGPEGPEGAPPAEAQAEISAPVGPLSGPTTECGTLTTYQLPGTRPGAVAVDADRSVWFTEPSIGAISHMTVTGQVTRQFLPTQPGALLRDPRGDIWFTDAATNAIWRLSPSGETRRLPVPTTAGVLASPGAQTGSGPSDLTVGGDGNVWFIESEADQVARISPDLEITELPLSRPEDGHIRPTSITAGPDGSIWVSAALGRRVARVDGRTLRITQFPIPHGGSGVVKAASLAVGDDGAVWFEDPATPVWPDPSPPSPPALGRMDGRGSITYHQLPGASRWPGSLTAGPDDAIWFLDGPAKTVGRMAPDGTLTEFPFVEEMTTGGTAPRQLAAGPDTLWFAQPHTSSLGLITCRTGPPPR